MNEIKHPALIPEGTLATALYPFMRAMGVKKMQIDKVSVWEVAAPAVEEYVGVERGSQDPKDFCMQFAVEIMTGPRLGKPKTKAEVAMDKDRRRGQLSLF